MFDRSYHNESFIKPSGVYKALGIQLFQLQCLHIPKEGGFIWSLSSFKLKKNDIDQTPLITLIVYLVI